MTNIRARQPYARRPAPLGPLKPFLDTEFANIQRAVPVPLVRSVFADDTVQASDDTIEVDSTAGPVTVTLPPPDRLLFLRVTIVRVDAGSHNVIVAGALPDSSSVSLHTAGDFITVQSDGTTWLNLSEPFPGYANVARFGARGDGVADDRTAFANADAAAAAFGGAVFVPPGRYRIASNITMSSAVTMAVGAVLVPDNGVTVTFSGPFAAGLAQCFDGSLGGFVLFAKGSIDFVEAEWFGAVANWTTGGQRAVLASLGMKSLSEQSIGLVAPVRVSANYASTGPVFLPRYAFVIGADPGCGITLVGNNTVGLVPGRSLAETDFLDISLRSLTIRGDTTKTGQIAIQAAWSGSGGYAYPLDWRDVMIRDIGGAGIQIVSDSTASQLIKTYWNNVQVINAASGYAVRIKVGVFNAALFENSAFTDCYDGFFIEDIGSGTMATEAIRFQNVQFESLGRPLGGSYKTGGVGLKSTAFSAQMSADSCYFEGNGNKAGDTTGANIDVTAPWNLSVTNSILASTNNQIIMRAGGNVTLEGNYIASGANISHVFLLDSPPVGSDFSTFTIGVNRWDMAYTQAQLIGTANSPTTQVLGYQGPTTNYYAIPPRVKLAIYRDTSVKTADSGAIGYSAVKRLANNSGGSTSIANNGIASICNNTVTTMILVTEYNSSRFACFLLAAGRDPFLMGQDAANKYTITKDNATTLNVYNDTVTTNTWVVQNKSGSTALLSVRFFGNEPMEHADDGYYETQFA